MLQERPVPSDREELVRAYGPDDEFNKAAIKAVTIIEKALKEGGRINFNAFDSPPFFIIRPVYGGMGGFDVDISLLEENGKLVHREVGLGLRCTMGDVHDFPEFLEALEARTLGWFECELDAVPELGEGTEQKGTPTLFKDSAGRIILQGVRITDWREIEKEYIYPREPGETKAALSRKWIGDSPFGHCPACGSIGIEDLLKTTNEVAVFSCCDKSCRTTYQIGGSLVVFSVRHTEWGDKKPSDWEDRIKQGSWNQTHFSPEFCLEHNLV